MTRPLRLTRSVTAVAMAVATGAAVPAIGRPARPTSVGVRTVFVGGAPDRVAINPAGVWVGDLGHLARVDPTTDRVVHVAGATTPIGVASDQVWAGVLDRPDAVARIDPHTGHVVARLDLGGAPTAIAIGFGAVWVLDSGAVLTRIDPATNAVTARVPLGGTEAAVAPGQVLGAVGFSVAAGDGAVWASGRSLDNRHAMLWRVDPSTGTVTAATPTRGDCAALAGGTDDVWGACGTAQRIDPATSTLVDRGADALDGIVVDGPSTWALGRDGTVTRLDATSGRVLAAYAAPSGSEGVAAGAGALWLASPHLHLPSPTGAGTLLRLAVPGIGS